MSICSRFEWVNSCKSLPGNTSETYLLTFFSSMNIFPNSSWKPRRKCFWNRHFRGCLWRCGVVTLEDSGSLGQSVACIDYKCRVVTGGFGKSQVSEEMRQRKELVDRVPHGFVLAFWEVSQSRLGSDLLCNQGWSQTAGSWAFYHHTWNLLNELSCHGD